MLSIVMPVFNEGQNLANCLDSLLSQPGDYEIIVVDGGSVDQTGEIVSARSSIRLLSANKGRGSQMNTGARAARGDWLLFLHADTFLPADGIASIAQLTEQRSFQAACCWHRFDSRHPWLQLVSLIHNLRFLYTKVIYGDQALLIERKLFEQLGGFKEGIVMEDIEFSVRLRQVTKPICLPLTALTSARKFYALGIYRATIRVLKLMYAYGRKDVAKDPFFSDIR